MYAADGRFLYEIIEDYQEADEREKKEIFQSFCAVLWDGAEDRGKRRAAVEFTVDPADKTAIALFAPYRSLPCMTCRTKAEPPTSQNVLRQKIQNLYTRYCDGEICFDRHYRALLHTPKNFYNRYRRGDAEICGLSPDRLKQRIEDSLLEAEKRKEELARQKLSLTWGTYQSLIEAFLLRCFHNYVPCGELERQQNAAVNYWSEDHSAVRYLSKSLSGFMQDYQKEYYGLKKGRGKQYARCACGALYEVTGRHHKYCSACRKEKRRVQERERKRKKRSR